MALVQKHAFTHSHSHTHPCTLTHTHTLSHPTTLPSLRRRPAHLSVTSQCIGCNWASKLDKESIETQSIFFVDSNNLFTSCDAGINLCKTLDSGFHWKLNSPKMTIQSIWAYFTTRLIEIDESYITWKQHLPKLTYRHLSGIVDSNLSVT